MKTLRELNDTFAAAMDVADSSARLLPAGFLSHDAARYISDANCRGLDHREYGIGSAFVLTGVLTLLGGLLLLPLKLYRGTHADPLSK